MNTTRKPTRKSELIEWANERCLLEHLDHPETLTLDELRDEIRGAEVYIEVSLDHQAMATDRQLRPDATARYINGESPWVTDTTPRTAWGRSEYDTCQAGTPGCSIDHVQGSTWSCETW